MSSRLIKLFGFEEGLAEATAAGFTFKTMQSLVLVPGRHVWAGSLPTVEDLKQTYPDYDFNAEPSLSFNVIIGPGVPTTSSSSSKQEWNIQAILRFGRAPEIVKGLLEDLADWLLLKRGRLSTGFQVKGAEMVFRPTILDVSTQDHVYVSTVIRFRAVPLPS